AGSITGRGGPAAFPGDCGALLIAFSQAAVIQRAPKPASWLHVFERDMKTHCIRLVERLRHAWRSLVRAANRNHNPFLVYNMASFNFGGGWSELLLKAENT